MTHDEIYEEMTTKFTREDIDRLSEQNHEQPFGFIINYIRNEFGIPKVDCWDIAEKVEEHLYGNF